VYVDGYASGKDGYEGSVSFVANILWNTPFSVSGSSVLALIAAKSNPPIVKIPAVANNFL